MMQLQIHDGLHPFGGGYGRVLTTAMAVCVPATVATLVASALPDAVALPLMVLIALAAIWCSGRFALPEADRRALGKTGRRLRLTPA
jgi:hypothetical protein